MTYKEKFEDLHARFERASARLMAAQKALSSIFGWGDSIELTEFLEAKKEFEQAGDEYHTFLLKVRDNKIRPEQPLKG